MIDASMSVFGSLDFCSVPGGVLECVVDGMLVLTAMGLLSKMVCKSVLVIVQYFRPILALSTCGDVR